MTEQAKNSRMEEDRHLLEQWLAGNSAGFSKLYERHKSRVFGFLLRMTTDRDIAEDILQETFFAALRNANQFDMSKNFLSWLFGIAHKRLIDYYRHLKVENDHIGDTGGSVGSKFDSQEQMLENKRLRALVNEAVGELDPAQREVFLLRELGGVSFKEIAELTNCPLNTALGRMHLALKNMRKELKKRGVEGAGV